LDYYAILGVHPTAEDIVIRAAYKALAQRYHPDRSTGPQDAAHAKMSELTKAYEVLADPVRRKKYDRRRQAYTQSVANYFNGVPRDSRLAIDPRNRRAPAAIPRRFRVALSALMIAVVVLSAFNAYQYSAQLRDWVTPGSAAQTAAEGKPRTPPDASAAVAAGGTQPGSASARNLPIGQAGTSVSGTVAAEEQAPSAQRPDAATAVEIPMPKEDAGTPTRQIAAEAAPVAVTPVAAPAADAASIKELKRTPARSAATETAPASRPTVPPQPAAGNAPCSDTVVALGLCSPPTTARNK